MVTLSTVLVVTQQLVCEHERNVTPQLVEPATKEAMACDETGRTRMALHTWSLRTK